ncbi:Peptidoglycan/LPS O-acetylase OafA/YrhL, contains acyltransferase and SGNH-hydrolase domains [Pseudomonas sp. Z003-0.4C(8344-21)]|uniref:acyltransferase family protein n=1 Tax=Pseudomonas sp. Z003-0.4C(8344-21) TaxID=1855380 RepID=UPI00087C1B3D|nr:acyltransferase family protein [Pseudomonas sp. Z003-0.4C(8344-21)]SDT08961.1 Peptidoglycan/LPS O-acetylase OafA/YrhL, contains acyltransferase and SGNH-hydrolase domains [Pseudomonas sp. Z003-0.4C(8344-21)]
MFDRSVEAPAKPALLKNPGDQHHPHSQLHAEETATAIGRNPSIEYRADIDGLRAIAVLLVLIFHGGLALFPSGYIGVDIFFVISGYLTTSIIMTSLDKGSFSFSGFYTRRIWRLQPAIIALLIVTLLITTLLYLPSDYVDFLKSEKYTSLLISNQYFSKVTSGYATPDAASLPLLHTWSLAIEWQWYLALPLGLWLLNRYVAKRVFKATVLGLTLAAMALALYLSYAYPDRNYYFFTARIFELMIGSCAVIFSSETFRLKRLNASLICALALATLFYCATREDILSGFPGYHAIAVCLATAVLLFRGIGDASVTSRLLAFRPLVFIGTLSYSLYVWHWPILAVTSYLGIALTPLVQLVYFGATFVIGYLSFVLIENRFRKARAGFGKTLIWLMIVPAIALSLLHSAGDRSEGWPNRFNQGSNNLFNGLKASVPANREACLGVSDGTDPGCIMGAAQARPQVLLMGDSYSNHYWGFVETLAKDANLAVLAQGYPACLALPNIYLYNWYKAKNALYQKCHNAAQRYYEMIASHHFRYVIIGQFWEAYLTDAIVTRLEDPRSVELSQQRLGVALRQALDIIVKSGATPVFLMNTLPMPTGINECLLKQVKLRGLLGSAEQSIQCASVPWSNDEDPTLARLFSELQGEYPSLIVIDPKSLQCKDGACATTVDGLPVYRDLGHMTDYASYRFGEMYLKRFGNPLKGAQ